MKNTIVVCLLLFLPVAVASSDPVPPPLMLAKVYRPGIDVTEYLVSEKLDGVRGHWTGEHLLTRSGHHINTPPWFVAGWPKVPLDGELWIARERFADISGIVRTTIPDDDAWRDVKFMLFDLPAHAGTFGERAAQLAMLANATDVPWLRVVEQFRVRDTDELERHLARVISEGGEGLMLHHRDARYLPGRSDLLFKLKAHDDAEALVVGHTRGEGKYTGMLGALVVERPDGLRFRVGTGFTDAERTDPPPIGTWITYRFNGLTSGGVPRFARFMRVRGELPPPDPE